jgi:3-methyladenine DNA glycosylase AlkD
MPNHVAITAQQFRKKIHSLADPVLAASSARFFKTGPGEYGEKDIFLGLRAATVRQLAKEFRQMPLGEVENLLGSEIHEERAVALLILVLAVHKATASIQKQVFDLYLANTRFVNNWDLVDVSAPALVGGYLVDKSRQPLYRLARSLNLWERRMAIVATQHFIRQNDFADTLKIAKILLKDKEDLIHKAVGWMLREVGKRDQPTLESFLQENHAIMPRTMLRYAIERLPEVQRQAYLKRVVASKSAKEPQ